MNDNAKKWVAALRSGDWKQGSGKLQLCNGEDRYCCLGVGVRLYLEEHPGALREVKRSLYVEFYDDDDVSYRGALPEKVQEWLELRDPNGAYSLPLGQTSLAYQNDHGSNFEQIADIIESEPEGLFVD